MISQCQYDELKRQGAALNSGAIDAWMDASIATIVDSWRQSLDTRQRLAAKYVPMPIGFGAGTLGAYADTALPEERPAATLSEFVRAIEQPGAAVIEATGGLAGANAVIDRTLKLHHGNKTIHGHGLRLSGAAFPGHFFECFASEVVMVDLRLRPGDPVAPYNGSNRDALTIYDGQGALSNIYLYECSLSHSVDELLGVGGNIHGAADMTFDSCIFSDPVDAGQHSKGGHGYGPFFEGSKCGRISMVNCVIANFTARGPLWGGALPCEMVLCDVWGMASSATYQKCGTGPRSNMKHWDTCVNYLGNRWTKAPYTSPHYPEVLSVSRYSGTPFAYFEGNIGYNGDDNIGSGHIQNSNFAKVTRSAVPVDTPLVKSWRQLRDKSLDVIGCQSVEDEVDRTLRYGRIGIDSIVL